MVYIEHLHSHFNPLGTSKREFNYGNTQTSSNEFLVQHQAQQQQQQQESQQQDESASECYSATCTDDFYSDLEPTSSISSSETSIADWGAFCKFANEDWSATGVIDVVQALAQQVQQKSDNTMLESLVDRLPSGTENGVVLAVDVGGSTLRAALLELHSGNTKVLQQNSWEIPDNVKQSDGRSFFNWIGERISVVLKLSKWNTKKLSKNGNKTHLDMGLSWSFPFVQDQSVDRAKVLAMGKGYDVQRDLVGCDLKDLFESCLAKWNVKVKAIVNDTVAALLAHAYSNTSTKASVILGTGVNAAIVDHTGTLINTEISLLGGHGALPQTIWDQFIDRVIVERSGFQPLETMIGGRYLGEIVRVMITELVDSEVLAVTSSLAGDKLRTPFSLSTKHLAKIESLTFDSSNNREKSDSAIRDILFEALGVTFEGSIELICEAVLTVSARAATYLAASLAALALNMELDHSTITTISYSGTVIEKYPGFASKCQSVLNELAQVFGLPKMQLQPVAGGGTVIGPAVAAVMYP